jgi:hypothetical protein
MAIEGANIKVSFAVKGEKTESDPNDTKWPTVEKLYSDVGHAHPSPGEAEQAEACRISKHLRELCVRQAIQTVVLVEQKHSERQSHHVSTRGANLPHGTPNTQYGGAVACMS